MADLNRLLRREKALHEVDFDYRGFEWIDCHNYEDSTLSYIRRGKDPGDYLIVCNNFTPVVRQNHRLGVPEAAWFKEIFNSDSSYYGGSNVGNYPGVHGRAFGEPRPPGSIVITLPPLATVVFKPQTVTTSSSPSGTGLG